MRYKFVKQFENPKLDVEILEIGKEYEGDYIPKGWGWTVKDNYESGYYTDCWELVNPFVRYEDRGNIEIKAKSRENNTARRYNTGKLEYNLLDLNALDECVKVLQYGAHKYSIYEDENGNKIKGVDIPFSERFNYKLIESAKHNWKKGLIFSETLASMMRHIKGLQAGEWIDPESGLPHIGHLQCNTLFLGGKNNIIDMEFKDKPEDNEK